MSKITTNRFPARHGAQWKGEEYHKLILGIEQGLTLAQLAERHERTPGSVTNGAKVIHIRRLKSDPGVNLLS
ncbi:hypothetical protein RKH34_000005 [Salmonella enterica]|nr:hypothetical protein [Salmonella enterica]